jgi:PilZ domain
MELTKQSDDHRWSARQHLMLPVKVYDGGEPLGQGRTQNVGIGGMFIELHVPDGKKLRTESRVSVAFTVTNNGNTTHHRLPATVIWSHAEGAGLMFTDFNVETVHTLRDILYPQ